MESDLKSVDSFPYAPNKVLSRVTSRCAFQKLLSAFVLIMPINPNKISCKMCEALAETILVVLCHKGGVLDAHAAKIKDVRRVGCTKKLETKTVGPLSGASRRTTGIPQWRFSRRHRSSRHSPTTCPTKWMKFRDIWQTLLSIKRSVSGCTSGLIEQIFWRRRT